MENKLDISLTRFEYQLLANCVTHCLNNDDIGGNFGDRLEMLTKLNEKLDDYEAMEGE